MNTLLNTPLIVKIIALLAFVAATSTLIVGLNQQQAHQHAASSMVAMDNMATSAKNARALNRAPL